MSERAYNSAYSGDNLNRVAFPIGGIGAGMVCLEGTGAISHVSVRNKPDVFNEPCTYAALCVKGEKNVAKVLEGPVPKWKVFGTPGSANGAGKQTYGFPRFREASFAARFPFATVSLRDEKIPLTARITGWSPFIPCDPDNSSLPVGALEYKFVNPTDETVEAVFSFNSMNFMATAPAQGSVLPAENGFVLWQEGSEEKSHDQGAFCICVDEGAIVDHVWFRGAWFDPKTVTWKNIQNGVCPANPPVDGPSLGASLFVPFTLEPGQEKTVRVMLSWHVPVSDVRHGVDPEAESPSCSGDSCCAGDLDEKKETFVPWYTGKFQDIEAVASYWRENYDDLRSKSALFRDCFYDTTLPPEVIEAAAANLTILKSPTVLRQTDGRLWCYEGCCDDAGCCFGSCTHVWNYAQAIPHLFPSLERSLRDTEFNESQDERGHQMFRSSLPIRPTGHPGHAAADGQLGGIMQVYREWRISGDSDWLKEFWPKVRASLDYCINTWDPKGKGILEEPHHNTYDIEFWGPDGMCTSMYLGALKAAVEVGTFLEDDVSRYRRLLEKGKKYAETELFNGEYFFQKVQLDGLQANVEGQMAGIHPMVASPEAKELVAKEGPKYQYGTGCLSDGVIGCWCAHMCGLGGDILDEEKVRSTLNAICKYNFKKDLSEHANPQRPSFALGDEGGLLLCTWPKGDEPTLPFVYSNEVWTGIEYQVASHLILEGMVEGGLDIVRAARDRYDGTFRNPFDEYECGHWYARALSSYGLIQALTGVRYDAVDKTLYIDSKVGDSFRSFLSTATGFGTVGLEHGKPSVEMKHGELDVQRVVVSGKETTLS